MLISKKKMLTAIFITSIAGLSNQLVAMESSTTGGKETNMEQDVAEIVDRIKTVEISVTSNKTIEEITITITVSNKNEQESIIITMPDAETVSKILKSYNLDDFIAKTDIVNDWANRRFCVIGLADSICDFTCKYYHEIKKRTPTLYNEYKIKATKELLNGLIRDLFESYPNAIMKYQEWQYNYYPYYICSECTVF